MLPFHLALLLIGELSPNESEYRAFLALGFEINLEEVRIDPRIGHLLLVGWTDFPYNSHIYPSVGYFPLS